MLVPSAVDRAVSVGSGTFSTILVGAIFATGAGPESEEGDLALIFEAPDGGLDVALRGAPTLRIAVDELVVFDSSIEGLSLLITESTAAHQSLMLAVSVGLVQRIAKGSAVRIWMGKSAPFDLDTDHLDGLRALLAHIPEGIKVGPPRPAAANAHHLAG
jgi:hypothetical protein